MKLLIGILILSMASVAMADMLVWDANPPDQQVTNYKVYDNGVELAADVTSPQYDLGVIDSGAHSYTVIACNVRGCSEASVPLLLPSAAGVPSGLNWIKE